MSNKNSIQDIKTEEKVCDYHYEPKFPKRSHTDTEHSAKAD